MTWIFAQTETSPLLTNLQGLLADIANGRGEYSMEIWGMPLALVLIGILAGTVMAVMFTNDRRSAGVVATAGHQADLTQQRNNVIEALHALELEREKISEEDYLRERKALLTFGASAMRELEEPMTDKTNELTEAVKAQSEHLGAERVQAIQHLIQGGPLPTKPTKPRIPGVWLGVLITVVAVFALGLIALVVTVKAPPERADVAAATQRPPQQRSPMPPPPAQPKSPTPEELAWQKTIDANPADLLALDGLTNGAILREDWTAARKYNAMAMAAKPDDASARTFEALLTYQGGEYPKAISMLDAVIADNPEYSRVRELRGIVHMQLGEFEQAVVQLDKAKTLNVDTERQSRLQMMADQARQAAERAKVANVPELGGAVRIEGVELPQGASLFLSVTVAGSRMPLRAKKLGAGPFPMQFTITGADAPMQAGPLPETVTVSVKVDLDGNPMGDDPGAPPKVVIEGVKSGALDVELVVRP